MSCICLVVLSSQIAYGHRILIECNNSCTVMMVTLMETSSFSLVSQPHLSNWASHCSSDSSALLALSVSLLCFNWASLYWLRDQQAGAKQAKWWRKTTVTGWCASQSSVLAKSSQSGFGLTSFRCRSNNCLWDHWRFQWSQGTEGQEQMEGDE